MAENDEKMTRRDLLGHTAKGACLLGLGSSYTWNLPYGPTLVLFLGLFFVGAMVLRAVLRSRRATLGERSEPCPTS